MGRASARRASWRPAWRWDRARARPRRCVRATAGRSTSSTTRRCARPSSLRARSSTSTMTPPSRRPSPPDQEHHHADDLYLRARPSGAHRRGVRDPALRGRMGERGGVLHPGRGRAPRPRTRRRGVARRHHLDPPGHPGRARGVGRHRGTAGDDVRQLAACRRVGREPGGGSPHPHPPQPQGLTMRRLTRDVLATLPEGTSAPDYLDDEPRVGIVHFGVGNFHRAHQAMNLDRLMHAGLAHDWAICGVGLLERDARMRDALTEQDGLYTLTLRHPDGRDEIQVIGSIRRFLHAPDDPDAVLEQLADPGVRIVSLTIIEGGYVEDAANGRRAVDEPLVRAETAEGLAAPRTAFGWIVAGLRERRRRGVPAFTVLCCDNIQGNGEVARRSVEAVARLVDEELADWIAAEVAFPSTMVDRITPVTTPAAVDCVHERLGVHDAWPVASEPFTQWVIEDRFPAG